MKSGALISLLWTGSRLNQVFEASEEASFCPRWESSLKIHSKRFDFTQWEEQSQGQEGLDEKALWDQLSGQNKKDHLDYQQ